MGVGRFHEWLVQLGNGAVAMGAGIPRGGLAGCPVVKVFLMELGKQVFGIDCQMFYLDRGLFIELGGFRHELLLAADLELMRRASPTWKSESCG